MLEQGIKQGPFNQINHEKQGAQIQDIYQH